MDDVLETIRKYVEGLNPKAKAELRRAVEPLRKRLWIPDPRNMPQTEAYHSLADMLLFGGSAGGGKGLRPSELVLTPFGWKPIGELKVGSKLCATDGTVTDVIGVFPRGPQPLYRLTWHDGSVTICDEDHIWLGWLAGKSRKIGNQKTFGALSAKKWTTRQIADHYGKEIANLRRFGIPCITAPVAFNVHGENRGPDVHLSREIPPYVLGVLLGDGSISGEAVTFSKPDDDVAIRVEEQLAILAGAEFQLARYDSEDEGKCPQYRIPNGVIKKRLQDLGLMGCKAETKFIPRIYLLASVEERWELLRGLMDTDGWAEDDGDCYFGSSSLQLAEDVRHLARSLGAIVTWREKTPSYTYNGERKEGLQSYTLRIKMPQPERMFSLDRKAERCTGKCPQSMGIWLESIEPAGTGETVCIRVSHPNNLFVIDNFLVTHNSDLIVGLALTQHTKSVIFRRQAVDLRGVEDRLIALAGRDGWNGADKIMRLGARMIELGHLEKPGAEQSWMGRPHDLIAFDEAAQLAKSKVQFVMGWNRTTDPKQRCRVVLASNPPTGGEGDWLVEWFAPWLDPRFPSPALPGELRYAATAPDRDGTVIWLPDNRPIVFTGEGAEWRYATEAEVAAGGIHLVRPLTRTFIRSWLANNPYLSADPKYQSTLQAMPEPYRSQLLAGDFLAARQDHEWQVIPSAWVKAAQARWTEEPPNNAMMTAIGCDIAQGGGDRTVLACRHGPWFAELIERPGKETPRPSDVAGMIVTVRRDNAAVVIDFGGGYGGGVKERLEDNGIFAYPFVAAGKSTARAEENQIGFVNKRAEVTWRFREALNPDKLASSEKIALPPDPELFADLTALRWKLTSSGIQVESKEELKKAERLGRSPDKGDAVIMCWSEGLKASIRQAKRRQRRERELRAALNKPFGQVPQSAPMIERGTGWMRR